MKARDFFQLVRIPTVFSSLSNAYAGFWIGGGRASMPSLCLGLLAAGLYVMAGMALNDLADYKTDCAERPQRPLPSGAISRSVAWILSLGMLALALVCQWFANPVSAVVGVLLIVAIFLYNFALKRTLLGPVGMGACRLLNLLCGIALGADSLSDLLFLPTEAYWALGSLGFYIACVTYLARDEVQGNSNFRMRFFFYALAVWACAWMVFAGMRHTWTSVLLLAALLFHLRMLHRPLQNLWKDPSSPAATGKTVGTLLRTLPLTDVLAMLGAGVFWPWALLGGAWMIPGPFLAKRFYST